jgi:hypothetical protein
LWFKASLGQIVCQILYKKNSTQNRAGMVAEVVNNLPSKHEALSSNPSTITTQKKKKGISLA